MAGSTSIILLDKICDRYRMPWLRYAKSCPFVVKRRFRDFSQRLSGIIAVVVVFNIDCFENLRHKKNSAGAIKNYGFCLFNNNFNFIFA